MAVEKKVIEAFNASHDKIHVTFEAVPYAGANDALATQIGSGAGPDIVGPVGIGGANAFHGQWLDLAPLIKKTNYDLSGYPQDAVNIYKLDEGQVGIPFAIYPSALFYKKGLFDEAGLKEPPHKYGDQYQMPDGTMADWNYDTINKIAKLLTVDKAGKDATQDGFDPANIVQWGFEPQRDDLRGLGAYWGAGSLAAADGKTAQIPEDWKTAWKFYYDGMWKDHFSMTGPIFQSTDINPEGYPFFTGKVAMSENFLWSTYGVAGAGDDWNLAAIPSNGSKATAAFNADTFRILKSTKHPDEAFEVLTYLLGDASQELLTTYGGFPARIADQPKGVEALQAAVQEQGRLAGRDRRHHPCRQPELRGLHAGLQRDARPRRLGRQVHDEVGVDARARHERRVRRAPEGDPVDLGQGGRWLTASASASLPISD